MTTQFRPGTIAGLCLVQILVLGGTLSCSDASMAKLSGVLVDMGIRDPKPRVIDLLFDPSIMPVERAVPLLETQLALLKRDCLEKRASTLRIWCIPTQPRQQTRLVFKVATAEPPPNFLGPKAAKWVSTVWWNERAEPACDALRQAYPSKGASQSAIAAGFSEVAYQKPTEVIAYTDCVEVSDRLSWEKSAPDFVTFQKHLVNHCWLTAGSLSGAKVRLLVPGSAYVKGPHGGRAELDNKRVAQAQDVFRKALIGAGASSVDVEPFQVAVAELKGANQ